MRFIVHHVDNRGNSGSARALETALPAPYNWALGLTIFQAFFIPTGWCYWKASQTCPDDIRFVRDTMSERASAALGI